MQIEYEDEPVEDRPETNVFRYEKTKPVVYPQTDLN